jgi:ribonuclease HI
MMLEKVIVNSDGGCRVNPGPGSFGYVISFEGLDRKIIGGGFEERGSNNWFEFKALAEAAAFLLRVDDLGQEIEFRSDSMLVVQTLNGEWQLKEPSLRDVFSLAQARLAKLRLRVPKLSIDWIKRAENSEADAICNEIQDQHGVVGISWKERQAQAAQARQESIRRMAQAADEAGLYDAVILPDDLA